MKTKYKDEKTDEECDLVCQVDKINKKLTKPIKYQYSCYMKDECDFASYIKNYIETYTKGKYKK